MSRPPLRPVLIGLSVAALVVAAIAYEALWTWPKSRAINAYLNLATAANVQDIAAVRPLCTSRYLSTHPLLPAREGGLKGLPRNAPHRNFRVWWHGGSILLCPANRYGPVFRFVFEDGSWKFDGPAGWLDPRGRYFEQEEGLDFGSGG